MPRRAIVIFPELLEASPIFELRRRFDPLAELVPPHLTLVFPFDSELTTGQMRDHVQGSVTGIAAFPVRLSQVTGSEGEYLFLNIKYGNDGIIALHDRLYTGLLENLLAIEYTFTPHMTIGRLEDRVAFRGALEFSRTLDLRIDIRVSEVSTYLIDATGPRRIELVTTLASS
jgi:2'-5' RNA ligase